jgi:hypothetical protein
MKIRCRGVMYGVVCGGVLAGVVGCGTSQTGSNSTELQVQWTSPPTSAWTPVASLPSSELPAEDVESEPHDRIAQAFEQLVERRVQCGRAPQECDVARLAVTGSTIFNRLTELMQDRIDNGITASDRGSLRVQIDALVVTDPGRATVATCLVDDTVLVIESAVYDDSLYSARSEWTLVETGEEWLWSDEDVLEWAVEKDLCVDE